MSKSDKKNNKQSNNKNNQKNKKTTKVNNTSKKNESKNNNSKNTNNNSNKKEKGKKNGFWKRHRKLAIVLKVLIILFLLMCLVAAGIVIAIFTTDTWDISAEDLTLKSIDTIIYDKDGVEIANVSGEEKRRTVTLSEIPQHLRDAYISIEDERFYSHKGVDVKRTLSVTVQYILNGGSASGGGGSTITQQLVKNLLGEKENSGIEGIKRKIREMSRAYKLEKMLSKDQILELYLNTIFVGSDVYGVELGSQYYFNKSVTDLDLAESAFLAGINHSPNSYNPFGETDNSDLIKRRTKTVLDKMLELGKINQEEHDSAVAEVDAGLKFEKGNTSSGASMSYLARAALNQVIDQYAEANGISTQVATTMIEGGGYKIYTTQDSTIQSGMEEIYRSGDHIFSGVAENSDGSLVNTGHTQSAMVVIDHKTGYVVGCMGGLGDDVDSTGINRATQSTRQPGSSMKPIAAIAPGLESGIITAATVYDESSTDFGNYHPTNSGRGLITVRKALEISANTTEVKIMSELGPRNSIEYLRKMGITSLVTAEDNAEHNDENLAMVLGGLTNGITPLEMAGAYAMIANDGVYITPTFYTRVEDSSGNTVLEPNQESTRVISEGNAYIAKSILTGPVSGSEAPASYCKIPGQETAGKTGTTTSNVDRWFCGFTNYYTAATWFGFDQPENLYTAGANSTNRAARLWASVMKQIHADLPDSEFTKPSNIVTARICLDSGKLATDECTRTYTEYFVRGTVPDYCDGHVKLTICTDSGKIANEHCPNTEEKTYVSKPEKEQNGTWSTNDGGKYNVPTETCDIHNESTVKMPNVVGKTEAEAKKTLENLGLKVTVKRRESDEEEGTVISQSQNEGTVLKAGDEVAIAVSLGRDTSSENVIDNTEVPDEPVDNTIETNTTSPITNDVA